VIDLTRIQFFTDYYKIAISAFIKSYRKLFIPNYKKQIFHIFNIFLAVRLFYKILITSFVSFVFASVEISLIWMKNENQSMILLNHYIINHNLYERDTYLNAAIIIIQDNHSNAYLYLIQLRVFYYLNDTYR